MSQTFIQHIPALIDSLVEQGWAVCDHFLSPAEAAALRQEGERRITGGAFHRATIGRSIMKAVRDDIRGDSVSWLDPLHSSAAEHCYWHSVDALQYALNRELFLGIRDGEFHYAHYPQGAFYKRHRDRFRDEERRVISVVSYLNENWTADAGGQLRLWLDEEGQGEYRDIEPLAGRVVVFRSERFWHEVLPASKERWSVTGWMRRG